MGNKQGKRGNKNSCRMKEMPTDRNGGYFWKFLRMRQVDRHTNGI